VIAEHLPADGRQRVNSLLCFAYVCSFSFLCYTASILNHEVLPFNSLSIPLGESEQVAVLPTRVKPQQ